MPSLTALVSISAFFLVGDEPNIFLGGRALEPEEKTDQEKQRGNTPGTQSDDGAKHISSWAEHVKIISHARANMLTDLILNTNILFIGLNQLPQTISVQTHILSILTSTLLLCKPAKLFDCCITASHLVIHSIEVEGQFFHTHSVSWRASSPCLQL